MILKWKGLPNNIDMIPRFYSFQKGFLMLTWYYNWLHTIFLWTDFLTNKIRLHSGWFYSYIISFLALLLPSAFKVNKRAKTNCSHVQRAPASTSSNPSPFPLLSHLLNIRSAEFAHLTLMFAMTGFPLSHFFQLSLIQHYYEPLLILLTNKHIFS